MINVGANEVNDALRFVRQAGLADVPVMLKVWAEMIHCFHLFVPRLEEERIANAEAGAFFKHYCLPLNSYGQQRRSPIRQKTEPEEMMQVASMLSKPLYYRRDFAL